MKFMYIDDNTDVIIEKFIPRIPDAYSRTTGENDTIPRVCVCPTLDGCLSAAPWQDAVEDFAEDKIPLRVYEFETNGERIISNNILYTEGLVDDANFTNEHWIMNEIKPTKIYDIVLEEVWYDPIAVIPYIYKDVEDYIDDRCGKEFTLSKYKITNVIFDAKTA